MNDKTPTPDAGADAAPEAPQASPQAPPQAPQARGKAGKGGFGTGRRILGAAEGLGTSVVIVLLVAALVYVASRPTMRVREDFTQGEHYSLTEQTKKLLAALDNNVEVITVMRPEALAYDNGLVGAQVKAIEYAKNLLEEYVVASGGMLSLQHVDPFTDQATTGQLTRDYHLTRSNVVLMRSGQRLEQIFLEELVTIDRGLAQPDAAVPAELKAFHGEGPLTSALLTVTSDELPRIGFLTGHGEPRLEDFEDFGLALLAESLKGQGMEVVPLDLSGGAEVPGDLDAVCIIGPIHGVGQSKADALAEFHAQGGSLLFALAPWVVDQNLDPLLIALGVAREHAILCRDGLEFEGPQRTVIPVHDFLSSHPISEPIYRQGILAVFPTVGGVRRSALAPPQLRTEGLAKTENDVFGDLLASADTAGNYTFDGPPEERGPRFVGMAVEGGPGRVVVFGSAFFLTNVYLRQDAGGPGNIDLALNSLNWLIEREDAIAARPRQVYESRVDLYGEEKQRVFRYVVLFMPLGGALLGLLGWFLRRR